MTLDELLALARVVRETPWARLPADQATKLAIGILSLLDALDECGWPEPSVKGPRSIWWEALGCLLTSDEARAIAAMLLRAADRAEVR